MTKQKTKALTPYDAVRSDITRMQSQFEVALPNQIPVQKFMRVLFTALQTSPKILECNRQSLYAACMKAAQDGLLPDGRQAALVPFKNEVVYLPMVAGILQKVRNSGELSSLSPHVVYENDSFKYYIDENGEHINHVPDFDGERGAPRLTYCIARTKDGAVYIEVMTKAEVEKVRSVSRAKDGPMWRDWWGEGAKKSVIKRLSKRLPMSTDLDDAIRADDVLFDVQGNDTIPAEEVKEKPKKVSRLAKIVKEMDPEPAAKIAAESASVKTPEVEETPI